MIRDDMEEIGFSIVKKALNSTGKIPDLLDAYKEAVANGDEYVVLPKPQNRKLKASYTVEMMEDLVVAHGPGVEAELIALMKQEVQQELKNSITKSSHK